MRRGNALSGLDLLLQPGRVEASLWRRFRFEAEAGCRQLLFNRYADLARSVAIGHYRKGRARHIDRKDYEQFAYEGLLQAIDRYDPLMGTPFSAYARRRIAGSIADGISGMTEVGTQIRHRRRLELERLRSLSPSAAPNLAEDPIAALSDVALGLALGMMLEGMALKEPTENVDPGPTAYESLAWRQLQTKLLQEVSRLPEREAEIIRQHYDTGLSFAQVAMLLGLSRGRVSQLHRSALEKLRKRIGTLV